MSSSDELLDLAHLVRRAETVKRMQERDPRLQRRSLRNQPQVHDFLDGVREKHAPASAARRHHVAMVAEDRQRMRGNRTSRDMKHGACQFTGNLEQVGNHQQQALAGRERCRQRAGLQSAVHRPGGAAFRLHLDHIWHAAPDVRLAIRAPVVCKFSHRRRRRDRIDRNHFIGLEGRIGSRLVAVNRHSFTSHCHILLILGMNPCAYVVSPKTQVQHLTILRVHP